MTVRPQKIKQEERSLRRKASSAPMEGSFASAPLLRETMERKQMKEKAARAGTAAR